MTDDLDSAGFWHEASIVTDVAGDITPRASGYAMRSQAANLLSASRFVLAIAWTVTFEAGYRSIAILGTIAIAGALSDLLDGRIARRMNVASGTGRWLDAIADIIFVLSALACAAFARAIPFYIPILIALSFSQYAIDSMLLSGAPIKSRLGHFGGIINYALVIVLSIAPSTVSIMRALYPLLAIFYIAAISERITGYFWRT